MEPTADIRRSFVAYLRENNLPLLAGNGRVLTELKACLGWTQETFSSFIGCERILVSTPHASPNVFFPRVNVGRYADHLVNRSPEIFHLRVVLTHNNLSDLGWKPYGWWRIGSDSTLQESRFFTRNKKSKHKIIFCLETPDNELEKATDTDELCWKFAKTFRNYAYSCIAILATTETKCGMNTSSQTLYVPLDAVVAFFKQYAFPVDGSFADSGLKALFGGASNMRKINSDGELENTSNASEAFVLENSANILLSTLFGASYVLGGIKMENYFSSVINLSRDIMLGSKLGTVLPVFKKVPSDFLNFSMRSEEEDINIALEKRGVPFSLSMVATEYGSFH